MGLTKTAKKIVEVCGVLIFDMFFISNNGELDENPFHVHSQLWYVQSPSPQEDTGLGSGKDCGLGV